METCESCKFFALNEKSGKDLARTIKGNCKRFPPMQVPNNIYRDFPEARMGILAKLGQNTVNPVVKIDDWCGEYVKQ